MKWLQFIYLTLIQMILNLPFITIRQIARVYNVVLTSCRSIQTSKYPREEMSSVSETRTPSTSYPSHSALRPARYLVCVWPSLSVLSVGKKSDSWGDILLTYVFKYVISVPREERDFIYWPVQRVQVILQDFWCTQESWRFKRIVSKGGPRVIAIGVLLVLIKIWCSVIERTSIQPDSYSII